MTLESLNYFLGLGTIVLEIGIVALGALFFLRRRPEFAEHADFIVRWGLWVGFLVAATASLVTVVHSEVFGLPPCPLCWWQRAFLYPQVVLFAVAALRKDYSVTPYSIALSAIGFAVAMYHHALQMFPHGSLPCPAQGEISCAQILFLEFGYVTYPMMAATLFAFLIALVIMVMVGRKQS